MIKLQFESEKELKQYIAENIINTSEAVNILNFSRQNLYILIKQEKLQPLKKLVKDTIFWKNDILARSKQKAEREELI